MGSDSLARRAYPRLTAHVIAESLGYACPTLAAQIIKDSREGRQNYCEWIVCCHSGDARKAVENSFRRRHFHRGFMAGYRQARALVERALKAGDEPLFASWF